MALLLRTASPRSVTALVPLAQEPQALARAAEQEQEQELPV